MPHARRALSLGTMPFIVMFLLVWSFAVMTVTLFLQSKSVTILATTTPVEKL
jgi:hypothetical protein